MVLWRMGFRSFDLYEAFRAYGLVATPGFIQVGRIIKKADGTFGSIFVQKDLQALPIDVGVFGQLDLLWNHLSLRGIA